MSNIQKNQAARKIANMKIKDVKMFLMPIMHILKLSSVDEDKALEASQCYTE